MSSTVDLALDTLVAARLYRVRKITEFFQQLEKDIRINYLFTRIIKLLFVELYCTHTAACIFYYLATTLPPEQEGYTWIGDLQLGDYSYSHFREIDLWKRYTTSMYFAIVTMATVGTASTAWSPHVASVIKVSVDATSKKKAQLASVGVLVALTDPGSVIVVVSDCFDYSGEDPLFVGARPNNACWFVGGPEAWLVTSNSLIGLLVACTRG